MSTGISHSAVRSALIGLAIIVLPPASAHAADPNVPLDPSAPAVEKRPTPQIPVSSPPQASVRPARRTPASFTPEMPLSEAIDILRNCTTPPLNVIVLWRDLDSAGIDRDTPIGIDGLPGLRVRQYLDLLVFSLSAGAPEKIDYTVHHGVITIATTDGLPAPKQITRVYDVSDLMAPPANYSIPMMGYGGMYGGQMMGPNGGSGNFGTGYGMGSSYMPGRAYGYNNSGGLPGLIGNSYGTARTRSNGIRRR